MAYTINQIAAALLEQNPELGELIDANPHASYHEVATSVKPIMRMIGEAAGCYVRINDIVWAIINAHQGAGTSLQQNREKTLLSKQLAELILKSYPDFKSEFYDHDIAFSVIMKGANEEGESLVSKHGISNATKIVNETLRLLGYTNAVSSEELAGFKENYYEKKSILAEYGIKYLYHMTHYKNLENILINGLLSHNNDLVNEHIDNAEVNDRRNRREPFYNKSLHYYVPFYFNPTNPMLFVNKNIQDDIIILAFDKDLLLKDKTIFTDGNAATNRTKFYYDLADLDKLNWNCINARYWTDFEDGKREIMAEVLVPNKVKIEHLRKIYCYDKATQEFILDLDDQLNVQININLYF